MAESEAIYTVIAQVAIQAATVAVMGLKETDKEPTSVANMANTGEAHRSRHSSTALRQSAIDWKALGKYIEILNFEMVVMNIM